MPKAILLGDREDTYLYRYGVKAFEFSGGVPMDVPVAVALALQRKVGRKGDPLFQIENVPEVVEVRSPDVPVVPVTVVERRPRPRQQPASQVVKEEPKIIAEVIAPVPSGAMEAPEQLQFAI